MILRSRTSPRLAILGCAGVLMIQSVWITLPGIFGRTESSPQDRAAAETAARLGVIRGDLWANFALTYSELAWPLDRGIDRPTVRREVAEGQAAAIRALKNSPHDARLWLLLAALTVKIAGLDHQPSEEAVAALKMAYYTAPNDVELSPYRLMIAVRPRLLADKELQQLVSDEVRMLVSRAPQGKPAIVAAYREASTDAKRIIESVVNDQDPELLTSARSEAGVH